jgi:hypothetical protein
MPPVEIPCDLPTETSTSDVKDDMPSRMIGINVRPDTKYLNNNTADLANNLLSAIQTTACKYALENITDDNLDQSFDLYDVPEIITSCTAELNKIASLYSSLYAGNRYPELRPILNQSYELLTDIVKNECVDDEITRTGLKRSIQARVNVMCNLDQPK